MTYKVTLRRTTAMDYSEGQEDRLSKIVQDVASVAWSNSFVWFLDGSKDTLLLVQAGDVGMIERVA